MVKKVAAEAKLSKAQLATSLRAVVDTATIYQERIAELELSLEDRGWQRMMLEGDKEFSREGLQSIADLCTLFYLKNPLINRAVEVQRSYVFGRGVSVSAKDPDINAVIQAFWDDPKNKAELTSPQSMGLKETDLMCDANVFIVLFTNALTGHVRVRSFPFGEIPDIICDPDDYKSPWFYKRVWNKRVFDMDTGEYKLSLQTAYYPDYRYRGVVPSKIGKKPVIDARVIHVKVGMLSRMKFGVPELYAALDWARAVTSDLERYATIKLALARFALSLTVRGGQEARNAAKLRLQTTLGVEDGRGETNPPPVAGSAFISTEGGAKLDVIRTAGAQPSPDEGRRLWLMVCAATGIPETILTGDSDVGNYATAKTLDRPTELKMSDRQHLWEGVFRDLMDFVMMASARAAGGALAGKVKVGKNPISDEPMLEWANDDDATVSVAFPEILEHDPELRIKAIVSAATLDGKQPARTIPDRVLCRIILETLDVDDVDEALELMFPNGAETLPFGAVGAPQPQQLGPDGTPIPSTDPFAAQPMAAALAELRSSLAVIAHKNGA